MPLDWKEKINMKTGPYIGRTWAEVSEKLLAQEPNSAYRQGCAALWRGHFISNCPYKHDTADGVNWLTGYVHELDHKVNG